MTPPGKTSLSRRSFLKNTGRVAAAATVAANLIPAVHAAENNTIQVALIGCGGRGTGAAIDALSVKSHPLKLVAMADAFKDRLDGSYHSIKSQMGDKVDVPADRQFLGFDAYQKAMDCLKPGDIVIFATPLAFRWVHFGYAIEKGLNVFMEKPLVADGACARRMFELGEQASAKNLKVAVGLMSRHNRSFQALADRIHDGEIGDIVLMRAYRMHGPVASMRSKAKPANVSEVEYQIRRFHSFLWASGGCYNDFYIHVIDHCGWMKNAWPVKAQALGGRHYREDFVDQNFDTYSVEYTFADGAKFIMDGRCMVGCDEIYSSFAHGTKGTAIISRSGDAGGPSATYKGIFPVDDILMGDDKTKKKAKTLAKANMIWEGKGKDFGTNPYQNEWDDLVDAVVHDKPYSEVKRGVEASLVSSMGRMAAHTGKIITYEQILNSKHELAPNIDKITLDGPAPVMSDKDGKYPVPQPGIVTDREYA